MKKYFFLCVIALLCITLKVSAQVVSNGLSSYYSFNNGNANDEIGDNHGVVNGAILTTDRFGNSNQAYELDGINDYITFGDSSEFRMGNSDFSLSFWLKYDQAQKAYVIGKRTTNNNYEQYGVAIVNNIGGFEVSSLNLQSYLRSNGVYRVLNSGDLTGSWHHIVLVHQYNLRTDMYVDNVLAVSNFSIMGGNLLNASGSPFVVGYRTSEVDYFYKGKIDDIGVYHRALSMAEVDSLYNAPDPVNTSVEQNLIVDNIVTIFPNPSSGILHIQSDINMDEIRIIDMYGKVLFHFRPQSRREIIQIPDIPVGIYQLGIRFKNKKTQIKALIVNKK